MTKTEMRGSGQEKAAIVGLANKAVRGRSQKGISKMYMRIMSESNHI